MRGKRFTLFDSTHNSRITPADAGKTEAAMSKEEATEDHPRGCGENFLPFLNVTPATGSPPRMRGKPSSAFAVISLKSITPADAGKT